MVAIKCCWWQGLNHRPLSPLPCLETILASTIQDTIQLHEEFDSIMVCCYSCQNVGVVVLIKQVLRYLIIPLYCSHYCYRDHRGRLMLKRTTDRRGRLNSWCTVIAWTTLHLDRIVKTRGMQKELIVNLGLGQKKLTSSKWLVIQRW